MAGRRVQREPDVQCGRGALAPDTVEGAATRDGWMERIVTEGCSCSWSWRRRGNFSSLSMLYFRST